MIKTFKSAEEIMGSKTFGDLTEDEENQIISTQSIENLVNTLNANFGEGKMAQVDLQGGISGLWFLQDMEAEIVIKRDESRVIFLKAFDENETTIFIDEDEINEWYIDDLTDEICIKLENGDCIEISVL